MPISTKAISFIPGLLYSYTTCDKVCKLLETDQWFSLDNPVSFTSKADSLEVTEIYEVLCSTQVSHKQNNFLFFKLILMCDNHDFNGCH